MSKEIATPVANVTVTNLHTVTAQILATKNTVGKILAMAYIQIGGLLTQAKELVPPGEWTYYLENEVEFSHRTANNYMKLFAEYSKNPESQALASMPYAKAIQLLSLPENDREAFMAEYDVEDMSSRELGQAIKERNEERKSREQAEALNAELSKSVEDAKRDLASSQEQVNSLEAALKAAEEKAAAAQAQIESLRENPSVPNDLIKKLSAEAASKAKELYQQQLDKASFEKDAAEKEAADLRSKLKAAQNAGRVSSPEAAAFSVLVPQIESTFNQVHGCIKKVTVSDPELGKKMLKILQDKMAGFQRALEA